MFNLFFFSLLLYDKTSFQNIRGNGIRALCQTDIAKKKKKLRGNSKSIREQENKLSKVTAAKAKCQNNLNILTQKILSFPRNKTNNWNPDLNLVIDKKKRKGVVLVKRNKLDDTTGQLISLVKLLFNESHFAL